MVQFHRDSELKMIGVQFKLYVLIVVVVTAPIESTKWLIDNPGFDDPTSWMSGYLPCAKQEIVFPENYDAILPLPKEVELTGFIFPRDGAILFSQDSTIDFNSDSRKRDCVISDRKAYLKKPTARKWFDPFSWRTTADMSRNTAVPHMERAPCNNDSVVIQRNGPIAIDLEYVPYLRVGQLSLAGSIISKDYLRNLFSTDIGQVLFQNSQGVTVEYYRDDVCGCHRDFKNFIEPICSSVYDRCERPHCLSPILPFQSCCKMCGAHLQFAVDSCDDSNLHKLTKLISIAIANQGLASDIDYHVSYINSHVLQAVIVDRDSYNEKSVAFVQKLNASTDWTKVFSRPYQVALQYSGRPYNGGVTFGSILLIILCLLFVAYVALVIVSHYAPDNRYVNMIPPWVLEPRRWRHFFTRSHFVFARFQNTGAGVVDENAQNLTMRFNRESDDVRECAFDNPMFNESGKREELQEPTTETQSLESVSIIQLEEPPHPVEERELTEIKLESSSDSSDEEETRE